MYGFDVYEVCHRERVEQVNGDGSKNYSDITIPIQAIREALESFGVTFEKLEEAH